MYDDFKKHYSSDKASKKARGIIGRVGRSACRKVFMLIAMLKSPNVPVYAKASIIGVLGYLICPIDFIPDFIPGGLADDLAAVALLLTELTIYKTPEVEQETDDLMASLGIDPDE